MLTFSMINTEMIVHVGQRLMELALTDPVGDIIHIQKDALHFMQNGESFYI